MSGLLQTCKLLHMQGRVCSRKTVALLVHVLRPSRSLMSTDASVRKRAPATVRSKTPCYCGKHKLPAFHAVLPHHTQQEQQRARIPKPHLSHQIV